MYQNFTGYHHGELLSPGTELKAGMGIHIHFKITQSYCYSVLYMFWKISTIHSVGIKTETIKEYEVT